MATKTETDLTKLLERIWPKEAGIDYTKSLNVGDRFIETSSNNWHSGDVKGVQVFTYLCEVVAVDPKGLDYKTVEMISEIGRPPFGEVGTRNCPISGSAVHSYINRSIQNGSITLV